MVQNFVAGGAAVNQLCRAVDADLRVYEMSLDEPTADFTAGPAMSEEDCALAIAYGMMAVEPGIDLLAVGEMGIANTTAAAALAPALWGGDAADWVGPGTGVAGAALAAQDRGGRARRWRCIAAAAHDPFELLRRLGGRELAAIVGAVMAARRARVPVLLDGYAATAAASVLLASRSRTRSTIASSRTARPSPAIGVLLERLAQTPLLDLGMRLGEASGATLAHRHRQGGGRLPHRHGDLRRGRRERPGLSCGCLSFGLALRGPSVKLCAPADDVLPPRAGRRDNFESVQVGGSGMRIVIVGQQAFGKAVLEAFIARGDEIAGVFAAPDKPGKKLDPLVAAAEERKLDGLTALPNIRATRRRARWADLKADLGVMAYVLLFAPPEFCAIPKHGMIQFHPSLLPLHRGPSSIPWAIIRGRAETGLSIFRPTPGLDEGPVILQKRIPIAPDDTAGSLYFDKIFPMGVEALVEAAELVVKGRATETTQDESRATYEGWVRDAESKINWASHVDFIYDLIRGCNPAPGAWTTFGEQKLYLFDAKKISAATFGAVRGKKIGEVVSAGAEGLRILAEGGFVEVSRVRLDTGAKIASSEAGIAAGTILGG